MWFYIVGTVHYHPDFFPDSRPLPRPCPKSSRIWTSIHTMIFRRTFFHRSRKQGYNHLYRLPLSRKTNRLKAPRLTSLCPLVMHLRLASPFNTSTFFRITLVQRGISTDQEKQSHLLLPFSFTRNTNQIQSHLLWRIFSVRFHAPTPVSPYHKQADQWLLSSTAQEDKVTTTFTVFYFPQHEPISKPPALISFRSSFPGFWQPQHFSIQPVPIESPLPPVKNNELLLLLFSCTREQTKSKPICSDFFLLPFTVSG